MTRLARLLHRLLGRRCFCGTRTRDMAAHQAGAHTPAELMQQEAMGWRLG